MLCIYTRPTIGKNIENTANGEWVWSRHERRAIVAKMVSNRLQKCAGVGNVFDQIATDDHVEFSIEAKGEHVSCKDVVAHPSQLIYFGL
jgi:hypothetical protein